MYLRNLPKNASVHDAFKEGRQKRLDNGPMKRSEYKLNEYRGNLERTIRSLHEIGKCNRAHDLPMFFDHCASWEQREWMRYRALYETHELSRNCVSATHGLVGDGISKKALRKIDKAIHRKIDEILWLANQADFELRQNWKSVKYQLGVGECYLDIFLDECLNLVKWILTEVSKSQAKARKCV